MKCNTSSVDGNETNKTSFTVYADLDLAPKVCVVLIMNFII